MLPFWTIWCRALGGKISDDKRESDIAAWIRTFNYVITVSTCFVIIAGVIRHWDDAVRPSTGTNVVVSSCK